MHVVNHELSYIYCIGLCVTANNTKKKVCKLSTSASYNKEVIIDLF